MVRLTLLCGSIALGLIINLNLVSATQTVLSGNSRYSESFTRTCQEIADSISPTSAVYYDGSPEYQRDIRHAVASATQYAACSLEPGTVEDVAVALKVLSRTRTPFAVKGGGHSANPGFSSTLGVQIAMSRFSEVVYDPTTETATLGAGLAWDDVYAALEPYGRNVVGGRLSGVGVAGYLLGGGYSWLSNQYGLAVDTVQRFELVMPNGTAINVTDSSNPDLFFALKGGGNNFGIVTRFTLKTFPQTQVWGGTLVYDSSHLGQVIQATANFAENNKDPKAAIIMSYIHSGNPIGLLWLFYDAPRQPIGVFDGFLAIPHLGNPIVRSFLSFVKSITGENEHDNGSRGVFHTVSTPSISVPLVDAVFDQMNHWGEHFNGSLSLISYGVQPFHPTLFEHNTTSSAYPPDRTRAFFPLSIYFGWELPEIDEAAHDAIRESAKILRERISQLDLDGGYSDPASSNPDRVVYPNYALFDTPLVDLYGSNLPRLQKIRANVDPENVMRLAGGFKF